MTQPFAPQRRQFLHHTARLAAAATLPVLAVSCASVPAPPAPPAPPARLPQPATPATVPDIVEPFARLHTPSPLVVVPDPRALAMLHTHTHEAIDLVYAHGERYIPESLGWLNRFLRDHYSGEVGLMDPVLFDLLHRVQQALGSQGSFEVISGYRGPATNEHLRRTRGGGVASNSLHTQGRAIDVRLPGVALTDLHEAALSLRAGGVGFYPREQFVHLDTGRVRNW